MPVAPTYPGVYIEELPSGVRPVIGVATSITAFVGYAARGPENVAVRLASFGDYERRFGGLDQESELGFAVQQFFRNGGADAIVVRVPKLGAVKGKISILESTANNAKVALELEATSTGSWSKALVVEVDTTGASDADSFNLTITDTESGVTERFIDLSIALDSPRSAFAKLNDADQGSDLVDALVPTAQPKPPLANGTEGDDLAFAPTDLATDGTVKADHALKVTFRPASTGPTVAEIAATVTVLKTGDSLPTPAQLAVKLQRLLAEAVRTTDGVAGVVPSVGLNRSGLGLRVGWHVDPDTADPSLAAGGAFRIAPVLANAGDPDPLGFKGSTANVAQYSTTLAKALGQGTPTAGTDGTGLPDSGLVIGSEGDGTGIYALLKTDLFNLLCIPEATRSRPGSPGEPDPAIDADAIWAAAYDLCTRRRALLLIDPPADVADAEAALDWITGLGTKGPNAAAYYPRVRIPDPTDHFNPRTVAPSGTLAGLYARTDADRGVWKAPAGLEARVRGITTLTDKLTDAEQGRLNPVGLNCLRTFPVVGTVGWGARTTDGADILASQWKYIPVRRLALFIEESVFRGTQWAVFEPNDEPLWSQLRLNLGSFMQDLFRKGAFAGRTPQEAYLVKCDKDTTTRDDVDRGVVNVLVGFAPLKPAEFVVIRIQQLAGQTAS